MIRHCLTAAAVLLAATAAATASAAEPAERPLRLAQSVNETLPGGVERAPSDTSRSAAPRALKAMPPPSPAPAAAAMPQAPGSTGSAKASGGPVEKSDSGKSSGGKKAKKAAPVRGAAPPTTERAPSLDAPSPAPRSTGVPRPMQPDESIPGGAERSPGNAQ